MTGTGSRMRRFAPKFLLLFIAVAAITAVLYGRFLSYRTSLQFFETTHEPEFLARDFSPLSDEALLQLGTAHSPENRPASSYQLHPSKKAPDTIRIGVFGCSFARGAETQPGGDFPYLLQREFESASMTDVEVINFGVGGYGLQQAYLLWQELGAAYDLDYTIFHLFSFHRQRDATFVQLYGAYGPVHARYVLDGEGKLEFVPVLGKDREQACALYSRFITPWRYLRFDMKPPTLLRSVISRHRQLDLNPFYYFRGPGELDQIYTLILEDLINQSVNFIAGCNDEESFSLREFLPAYKDHFFRLSTPRLSWKMSGIYRAPKGHLSALGNKMAASEYRSLLAGERQTRIQLASRSGWPEDAKIGIRDRTIALDHAKEVYLGIESEPIGVFVTNAGLPGHTRRFSFKETGTRSLIDLSTGSNIMYLPLKRVLKAGAVIEAELRFSNGGAQSAVIGEIESRFGVLGRVLLRNTTDEPLQLVRITLGNGPPSAKIVSERQVVSLRLLMDGQTILKGVPKSSRDPNDRVQMFDLIPASSTIVKMRAHPRQSPDVLNGLHSEMVSLVIVSKDSPPRAIPAFRITIQSEIFPERATVSSAPINPQMVAP